MLFLKKIPEIITHKLQILIFLLANFIKNKKIIKKVKNAFNKQSQLEKIYLLKVIIFSFGLQSLS